MISVLSTLRRFFLGCIGFFLREDRKGPRVIQGGLPVAPSPPMNSQARVTEEMSRATRKPACPEPGRPASQQRDPARRKSLRGQLYITFVNNNLN
jgi:hypothetical protein